MWLGNIFDSSETLPTFLWTCRLPFFTTIPEESYPLYSSLLSPSTSNGAAALLPMKPKIPHMNNPHMLITSEQTRLVIIKYDIGFVSLFIVLLKPIKSKAIKTDAIIGSPGMSQVRFNNIVIKQA